MSEANKDLVKRWFEEVWNNKRRSAIAEMLDPNAVIYEGNEAIRGPEGFYPFFDRMHATFSDVQLSTHDVIAEGDRVCARWSATMRHTGDALGFPATNKTVHTTGISFVRVSKGKLVEGWQNWDMLGLIQQIRGEGLAATYMAANAGD